MTRLYFLLIVGSCSTLLACSYMTADDSPASRASEAELRTQAADFCKAFNKGDAAAVTAFYSEGSEYTSDSGKTLRGRAEIEKAYAEHFKTNPGDSISIDIASIRFPSPSMAIEEGTIETRSAVGAALPNSTWYRAVHVRENGKWLTALTSEWGAGRDKLSDLNWLIGSWTATVKNRETLISFEWNERKNVILSRYTVKEGGKVVASGTQRIHADARTGGISAMSYDDSGEHGLANWYRDGNRWISETSGASPSGTTSEAVNIITRLSDSTFLWRTVNRVVNGEPVPDSLPVKLTRTK